MLKVNFLTTNKVTSSTKHILMKKKVIIAGWAEAVRCTLNGIIMSSFLHE